MEKKQTSLLRYYKSEGEGDSGTQEKWTREAEKKRKRNRNSVSVSDRSKKRITEQLMQVTPASSVEEAAVKGAMRTIRNMLKSGSDASRGESDQDQDQLALSVSHLMQEASSSVAELDAAMGPLDRLKSGSDASRGESNQDQDQLSPSGSHLTQEIFTSVVEEGKLEAVIIDENRQNINEYGVILRGCQNNIVALEKEIPQKSIDNDLDKLINDIASNRKSIKEIVKKIRESDYLQPDANLLFLQSIEAHDKKYEEANTGLTMELANRSNFATIFGDQSDTVREKLSEMIMSVKGLLETCSKITQPDIHKETGKEPARDSPKISPESLLSLPREQILSVVETFKPVADTIGGKCLSSPVSKKSFLFKEFCKKCEESKDGYKNSYELLKDQGSSDIEKAKNLIRYPQVVALLCKFTLKYIEEAQMKIEHKEKYNKFIQQVDSGILDNEQKQEALKVFQDMFKKCDEKLQEFNTEIDKGAHNDKNLYELERTVNHVQRDIIALGNIIRQDYFQSHTNLSLLKKIDTQIGAYKEAMAVCDNNRTEEHLRTMIKAVEDLRKSYSQLADLRIKGKEPAVDNPVRDHADRREDSDSEMDNPHKQIQADRELAGYLQEEEKLRVRGYSGPAMSTDFPHDLDSESEEKDKSTGSVSAMESDKADHFSDEEVATGTNLQKKKDDLERIEAIYNSGMQNIAQSKLELYLRDPTSLSFEEIVDVGRKLSTQLNDIHSMRLQLVGGSNRSKIRSIYEFYKDPKNKQESSSDANQNISIIAVRRSLDPSEQRNSQEIQEINLSDDRCRIENICEYFKESDGINQIEHEKIKELFTDIKRIQNIMYAEFKNTFNESKHKDVFEKFEKQINTKEKYSKKSFEAYKADILSKELIYHFLRKSENITDFNHITFAVAYMQGQNIEKNSIFVSTNDSTQKIKIKIVQEEYEQRSENITWIFPPSRSIHRKRHAEQVLIDHAKDKGYKIVGIGASRPFCDQCSELLGNQVDQKALGQIFKKPAESSGDAARRPGDSRTKETKLSPEQESSKLKKALSKHNHEWLGPLRESKTIISLPPKYIYTFKAPDGKFYGTNSLNYLVNNCPLAKENNLYERNLGDIWNLRENQSKKWGRVIPENDQPVEWYIPTMYALRKDNEEQIHIVYSLEHLQNLVNKQISKDIDTGFRINGWEIIKCKKLEKKEESSCLIINSQEDGQQGKPSYQELVDSKTPGLYLINRAKKMRAYWPTSKKEMNKAFCELAGISLSDNSKFRSQKRNDLIKGEKVAEWEKEHYFEVPKVKIQSPRENEYTLDPCASNESYTSYVVHLPEDGKVSRVNEQKMQLRQFRALLKGEKEAINGWQRLPLPPEVKEKPYEKGLIWKNVDIDILKQKQQKVNIRNK